jgi:hypothetical protein
VDYVLAIRRVPESSIETKQNVSAPKPDDSQMKIESQTQDKSQTKPKRKPDQKRKPNESQTKDES